MKRLKRISTSWTKGILIVRSDVRSIVVGNRRFLLFRPHAFDLIINHCIDIYIYIYIYSDVNIGDSFVLKDTKCPKASVE
jgi:hypothetical protein